MGTNNKLTLDTLFEIHDFVPNSQQREAINLLEGPLFLMAGPGSGKTKVLLWRTVNAIVFHNVSPERVFLSTFTEKAANQLKDGLQGILGTVTSITGVPYDISRMYVGTVHSLCQRIIGDRRFIKNRERVRAPILMDDLDQYFYINSYNFWKVVEEILQIKEEDWRADIKDYFALHSMSRHSAALSMISIFNRFSEENLSIDLIKNHAHQRKDDILLKIAKLYEWYQQNLYHNNMVDFSILQQRALEQLLKSDHCIYEFEYVVIDEYQDTNKIQEELFFRLALGNKNFCVVGDDDQALYRFRGATVENFVQFPERSLYYLKVEPKSIKLNLNYRSKNKIVEAYTHFIDKINWDREDRKGYYRLYGKNIEAYQQDNDNSVITTTQSNSEDVANEIAQFVKNLIEEKKVEDPNQIAFLFPALKNNMHVKRLKKALEKNGIEVYAPRAGRFLEVAEAKVMFGILVKIFGKPVRQDYSGLYKDFHDWLDCVEGIATNLMQKDKQLEKFINSKIEELKIAKLDYTRLIKVMNDNNWSLEDIYSPQKHKRIFSNTPMLSKQAIRGLGSNRLDKIIEQRIKQGNPFSINYILNRATSVDWNILDLFYRINGFPYFSQMFKLAENGIDEGPICNLSMISKYLARYMEQSHSVITGAKLDENHFTNDFFGRYIYGLFRIGESEVENEEALFPKGRVPFLTIHQSKGLEFPYVILGNPGKRNRGVSRVEEIVRPLVMGHSEPLEKIPEFDTMRLFYVALSRAEDLLLITNLRGSGQKVEPAFKHLFEEMKYPQIPSVLMKDMPKVEIKGVNVSKTYSYTSDYLLYLKCARNYMIFNKYGFVPSRSQTMLFGSLVHRTIEDIHNRIISSRGEGNE